MALEPKEYIHLYIIPTSDWTSLKWLFIYLPTHIARVRTNMPTCVRTMCTQILTDPTCHASCSTTPANLHNLPSKHSHPIIPTGAPLPVTPPSSVYQDVARYFRSIVGKEGVLRII